MSEVRTAGGEDHLVGGERLAVAGQSHVDEVLLVPQMTEAGQDRRLEIVPPNSMSIELLLYSSACLKVAHLHIENVMNNCFNRYHCLSKLDVSR